MKDEAHSRSNLGVGTNLTWHQMDITKDLRAEQKGQKPATLWLTGLSGSGKSTLANALESRLFSMDRHTMLLDGDNVRMGLNSNLGFSDADRSENIRRVAEASKLLNDAGIIVLTSFISPFRADRDNARRIIGEDFVEIYVSTSLEVCESRDPKGLYRKARSGQIPHFTGIDSPYEAPEHPEITVDLGVLSIEDAVEYVLGELKNYIERN